MARTSSTSGAEAAAALPDGPLERLGRQLRHPRGTAGRLLGRAMALANRGANRAAIAALEVNADDRILELGFGPGAAVAALAALAPRGRIHGVDASRAMLEVASRRNRAAIAEGRVTLTQTTFDRLPLPDDAADKVLAVNVVYFWQEPAPILREVRRVLRPGGLLCIYATDAATMRRWKFAGPATHRVFDRQGLTVLLRDGGFEESGIALRRIRSFPNVPGWIATARKAPQDTPEGDSADGGTAEGPLTGREKGAQ